MSTYSQGVPQFINTENIVSFNDKNLESAIRDELKLAESENITTINILNLTRCIALEKNIFDLSGLEHAENLQLVTFTGNNITSLEPLKKLKQLYSVGLAYNHDMKMEEVLKIEGITELDLSGNSYTGDELSLLAKYSDMTTLWLNACQMNSISFMSGMNKLVSLKIQNNNLKNIDALNSSRLVSLWATNNFIRSLDQVQNLTGLKRVWLDNNELTSLDWLNKMDGISHIYASYNKIDSAEISNLNYLYYLQLDSNNITEVELNNLPSLTQVSLNDNRLTSFSDVVNLPRLQSLSLSENTGLVNIEGLRETPKLQRLVLQGCPGITDFSPLSSLKKLIQLFCNNTGITDKQIRDVGYQSELMLLAVARGKLTHIGFMPQFPALKQVALMENHLSDISQLSDNISTYVATDQLIHLADIATGEKTEIRLRGRHSQRVDNIEWLTEGSISVAGDKQYLSWAHGGENKLAFSWQEDASAQPLFSGTMTQTVTN